MNIEVVSLRVTAAVQMAAFVACGTVAGQTPKPYAEILRAVHDTLSTHYFDPAFRGINLDSLTRAYLPAANAATNDSVFLQLVQQMLRPLQTSHLYLAAPDTAARFGIGVSLLTIGGEQVVVGVERGSDAQSAGVRVGDAVESPADAIAGPLGTAARVRVRGCDGSLRTIDVLRQSLWPPERPSVRWRVLTEAPTRRIGFLHIVRFDDDFAPLIDSAMTQLANTEGLVIDVRENSGGNLSYLRLVSYLADEPGLAVALLARPFLSSWGRAPIQVDSSTLTSLPKVTGAYRTTDIIGAFRRHGGGAAFYLEDLRSRGYRRPVVILAGSRTGSAAEGFVGTMKGRPRITVVGQPTAGALIGAETFGLPFGWRLTLPTHAGYGPDGRLYHDTQLSPDFVVPLQRSDLCTGRDAALAKALELLRTAP
jgi:carboxyl-terminal processing protease